MLTNFLFAHDAHYEKTVLKHWNIEKENKVIDGSFYMYKNNLVYIEDANDKVYAFPITSFSESIIQQDKSRPKSNSKSNDKNIHVLTLALIFFIQKNLSR
jgi:hypothetical protein